MKNAGFRALFKPKRTGGNIHFGKMILALIVVFTMVVGSFNVVVATEPLYYYNEYNSEFVEGKYYVSTWNYPSTLQFNETMVIYPSYVVDPSTGISSVSGTGQMAMYIVGGSGYVKIGSSLRSLRNIRVVGYGAEMEADDTIAQISKGSGSYKQGTLRRSNIIAEDGTYPNNGRHTNGYWYVRKGLVNIDPTITLSSPVQNSYFGKEGAINLQGTVRDTDSGDILSIKYTINGISAHTNKTLPPTITANGNNQVFTRGISIDDSITQGDHILKVWVEDNKGGKSTEVSRTIKIDKTNPTIPTIVVNENWSKEDVIATITPGTDAESGVDRTEYSLSGATTLGWTTYSKGITISNEGITTIKTRTIDNVGNISNEASKNVRIDKTKPKIKITIIRN